MTEDVRNRLDEELSWLDRAPVDAMVAGALTHGRHVRRVRRAGAKAGTVAVVGLTVVAVGIGTQVGGSPSRQVGVAGAVPNAAAARTLAATHHEAAVKVKPTKAAGQQNAAPAAAPVTHTSAPVAHSAAAPTEPQPGPLTSHPAGVPATTRGALQLLTDQLGTLGSTSHAGVASDGTLDVELYLTTQQGTGMVRVTLDKSDTPVHCPQADPAYDFAPTCTKDAAGNLVATWSTPGNCIQDKSVLVAHPDGTVVGFDIATCLAWDGTQNAPGISAITPAQAAAFGADPRWDSSMNPQLVADGASNFPSPVPFS